MDHKHKIKTDGNVTYCTVCGKKSPSNYDTCYGYDNKHSFKLQPNGDIICTKCGKGSSSSYNSCYGENNKHHYKKLSNGDVICTKCGRSESKAYSSCYGEDKGHNYDIDKDGNIVCKKCGKDTGGVFDVCNPANKPKREKKSPTYASYVAKSIVMLDPHKVEFLASLVYIKGGWSRTCLRGSSGFDKELFQNLRENIKEAYEALQSRSMDYVLSHMYDSFKKAEDDTDRTRLLSWAVELVSDRVKRLIISKALHYKDPVWDTLDEHLKYFAIHK